MTGKVIERGELTILIVEDDEDMNELLRIVLNQAGYRTICASDGEEALELAVKEKPDLVLLDIMLPRLDGVEVCRRLSSMENTRNVPIIMLTIKRELSTKLSCYIAGAKRYITKPFGIEEILSEIKNTLIQPELSRNVHPLICDKE